MHGSLTCAQIDAYADAFAVYLRNVLGLAQGARAAIQTPNCLTYQVVAFGILKAGCVLVKTNPLHTPAEMEHQFRESGAEGLVIVDMFADKLDGILARTALKKVIVAEVPQFFSRVPRAVIRGVMKWWNKTLPKIAVEHGRPDWDVRYASRTCFSASRGDSYTCGATPRRFSAPPSLARRKLEVE